MNAAELDAWIDDEGGVTSMLRRGMDPSHIEDDQLRAAWVYLQEEWNRFEVHVYAFEAILNGKLAAESGVSGTSF